MPNVLLAPAESITTFTEFLAREYIRLFRRHPLATGIMTAVIFAGIAVAAYIEEAKRKDEDRIRRETLTTYPQQLEKLDKVQQSLKDLSDFVFQQRNRLQESEQVIAKLKEEKERIAPLVQGDRNVVDAVFRLQEQRSAESVSRERWIGFGLGVGASLLASFIYASITLVWRRLKRRELANVG